MGAFPRKKSGIQGGMNDECEYSSALSPKLLVPSFGEEERHVTTLVFYHTIIKAFLHE